MTTSGKSSGSWKAWKGAVAWWIKTVLITIGIFIGSAVFLFIAYKSIHALRIRSLNNQIGNIKAQLESFS
jgi:hypothetical protein